MHCILCTNHDQKQPQWVLSVAASFPKDYVCTYWHCKNRAFLSKHLYRVSMFSQTMSSCRLPLPRLHTHERYQSTYQKAGLLNPESHDVYMLRPFAFARPCQTMLFSKPSPEGPHTSTILRVRLFLNHGTRFHYLYNCGDESLV